MTTQPVRVSGPLFRTDAGRKVKKAIDKVIIDVAKAGVAELRAELTVGHGVDSGETRRGIRRRKRGMSARVTIRDGRIAAWLQGTSKRNRTTRFKGYRVFTAAAARTDRTAGEAARKIAADLVRELGG